MAVFTPPAVSGVPGVLPGTPDGPDRALFSRLVTPLRGQNVYKMPDGSYLLDIQPQYLSNPDPLNTANNANAPLITYYGGHSYIVDATEAAALTAAGFGAYLGPDPAPAPITGVIPVPVGYTGAADWTPYTPPATKTSLP